MFVFQNIVRFCVSYPPRTGNTQHKTGRNPKTGRRFKYLDPLLLRWRDEVAADVLRARVYFGAKPVGVVIRYFMPDEIRRDMDNAQKVLSDALEKASAFFNDSQIKFRVEEHCGIDRENPRIEIDMAEATRVPGTFDYFRAMNIAAIS